MSFFGIRVQSEALREQEMDAEVRWNLELHSFEEHLAYAEKTFRIAEDAIRRLKKRLPQGRVLDAGAGSGCHSWQLTRHGYEVLAAELTPELLATASVYIDPSHSYARVVTDCTLVPVRDSTFNAVFCKELAHHVECLDELLEEFSRMLVPGGILILIEPVSPFRPRSMNVHDPATMAGLTHQHHRLDHYLASLAKVGFRVLEVRHFRRPVNRKYALAHMVDEAIVSFLRLNGWFGWRPGKYARAALLGGEVVLLAAADKRGDRRGFRPPRTAKKIPLNRLEDAWDKVLPARSVQRRLVPLLETVHSERDPIGFPDL